MAGSNPPGAPRPDPPGDADAAAGCRSARAPRDHHGRLVPAIPAAGEPIAGVLTGGELSDELLREAARLGYRTVVDLRGEREFNLPHRRALAEQLGLRWVHVPVTGVHHLGPTRGRQLLEAIEAEDALPAIVHCVSGDRVGALFAIALCCVRGASIQRALAIGLAAGMRGLAPAVHAVLERMAKPTPP